MAAVTTAKRGEHPEVEGLCDTCWKPSLRRYEVWKIDAPGLTLLGTRVWCRDERAWKGPLEETT
jgi:hypothetical protein